MRALLGGGGLAGRWGRLVRVWGWLAGVWRGYFRRFGGLFCRFGLGLLDGVTPAQKLDPTAGAFCFFGAHDETTHFQVGITAFPGPASRQAFRRL